LVRDELVKIPGKPESGRVITVKTIMGDISFWPNDMARQGMDGLHVTLGDTIRVVYLGKKKSMRNPAWSYKNYEVFKMLNPPQAQVAPAPQQARPAPIPVSEADRERDFQARQGKATGGPVVGGQSQATDQNFGVDWIEEQKKGLSQVPSAAEQGGH
jgi:hypothetical protein